MDSLAEAINIMQELQEDNTVSRNIKTKVSQMQKELQGCKPADLSLKANKIISDLEEISNDVNLPMFVRTQIYQLSSILETLC